LPDVVGTLQKELPIRQLLMGLLVSIKMNHKSMEQLYENHLKDWADAINIYFENLK